MDSIRLYFHEPKQFYEQFRYPRLTASVALVGGYALVAALLYRIFG